MVFSLLLMVVGVGAFCALLYNAVVYALPVTVGIEVGFWAIHAGAGSVGGIGVGILAGGLTFALGQFVFATAKSDILRFAVVLAFAIPAVIAGYSALLEIAAWSVTSVLWQHIFAIAGAVVIGGTAGLRLMTPLGEPHRPAGLGRAR